MSSDRSRSIRRPMLIALAVALTAILLPTGIWIGLAAGEGEEDASAAFSPAPPDLHFIPAEGLGLCPTAQDLERLQTVDHDGSFEYEVSSDEEFFEEQQEVSVSCGSELGRVSSEQQIPTSEIAFAHASVLISQEPTAADDPGLRFDVEELAFFDDWQITNWVVELDTLDHGLCYIIAENPEDVCEDTPALYHARSDFYGGYENLRVGVSLSLYTFDRDRAMREWAAAVTAEVTELLVERIPTN